MAPLRSILWPALLTGTCASDDATSMLQKKASTSIRKESAKGMHLLENAQTLISKINAGDDPSSCAIVSDSMRSVVDEAIPAILEQHTHYQNEIDSAAQTVENCPGDDLVQEGNSLNSLRQGHATCRMTEQELQEGLQPCHQYEQLRSSGYSCPAFPNDESGYRDALQQAREEIELHFNEAVALGDACIAARDALALKQEECASAQSTFEGVFCAHRLNCAGAQACRTTTEDGFNQIRAEIEAAVTSLESEYELFKHVECLLGHAEDAMAQQSIVSGDQVAACSDMNQVITTEEREQLSINYPTLSPLISCDDSVILQPPCEASFFEAEYANLPQREAIQAACASCPPLPSHLRTCVPEFEWLLPSTWSITASSSWDSGYLPDNVKIHTGNPWHSGKDNSLPDDLTFDAGEAVTLNGFATAAHNMHWQNSAMRDYTFSAGDDGTTFAEVVSGEGTNLARSQRQEIEFSPVSARYWKLHMTSNHGYSNYLTHQYIEFRTETSCT